MKNKGFTLIELLAVIAILALVMAIAIPNISNSLNSSYQSAYELDLGALEKAAKNYVVMKNIRIDNNVTKKVTIDQLIDASLIDEVLDPKTKEICTGYVIIGNNGTSYSYEPYLKCGTNYVSDNFDQGDVTGPMITILGDNPTSINVNGTYTDAGATAVDNVDGNVTGNIVTTSNINPNVVGTYYVTYTVIDSSGNTGTLKRTVNVLDNIAPTILFSPNGNSTYAKSRNVTVTVTDAQSDINNGTLKYQWTTSTTAPVEATFATSFISGSSIATPSSVTGTYYLWILAMDESGNKTISGSNAFNLDNIVPVITLLGNSSVTINKGSTYTDAGATAIDNIDGTRTSSIIATGTVNPSTIGTYYITYNVNDTAGNAAVTITRTINVVDALAPVITIVGSNPVNLEIKSTYTDAGATALDDVDGNVTSKIAVTSTINPNVLGTYTVTYTVSDNNGNQAIATRSVNVVDTIAPTITTAIAGGMLTTDPTFASGTNGTSVYNNLSNGNVTMARTAISGAPEGSGYGLTIQTTGTALPFWGGFTFCHMSSPNRVLLTRIVAKIPVGYTINWASNAIGNEGTHTWLTSQDGTGTWQEYLVQVNTGSTGTFADTNYFYINGSPTPTAGSPLIWYVAYAGTIDTTQWNPTNSVYIKGTDNGSGIVGYGINQSSSTAPTFTAVSSRTALAAKVDGINANGTYYAWVKDAGGNTYNKAFTVSVVDATGPTPATILAGGMISSDPTFASGSNGAGIYNNLINGVVTMNRTSISGAPEGSGYGLTIQSTGSASPGWGGFYFANPTTPNQVLLTRIVAKIPVGYTMNWTTNEICGGNATWLNSQAGLVIGKNILLELMLDPLVLVVQPIFST